MGRIRADRLERCRSETDSGEGSGSSNDIRPSRDCPVEYPAGEEWPEEQRSVDPWNGMLKLDLDHFVRLPKLPKVA